jgi:hypothetical protein
VFIVSVPANSFAFHHYFGAVVLVTFTRLKSLSSTTSARFGSSAPLISTRQVEPTLVTPASES